MVGATMDEYRLMMIMMVYVLRVTKRCIFDQRFRAEGSAVTVRCLYFHALFLKT